MQHHDSDFIRCQCRSDQAPNRAEGLIAFHALLGLKTAGTFEPGIEQRGGGGGIAVRLLLRRQTVVAPVMVNSQVEVRASPR